MNARLALRMLFGAILVSMLVVTTWASLNQPIWEWGGATTAPDHAWTIAALFDAYFGFITFYAWLAYKERGTGARIAWLIAILLLGNIAMSVYMLRELHRLPPDAPMASLLTARHG